MQKSNGITWLLLLVVSALLAQTPVFAMAAAPAHLTVAKAPDGAPLSQRYQVRVRPAGTDSW